MVEKTKGKKKIVRETNSYCFMINLPLRDPDDALRLNWLKLTVTDESGKIHTKNAWVTDHPASEETVETLVVAGRARWKIENEHIQTLKLGGYRHEHNFGHGKKHLSNILASLKILVSPLHTVVEFLHDRSLRFRDGSRLSFIQEVSHLI